jgi:hypothetical protein
LKDLGENELREPVKDQREQENYLQRDSLQIITIILILLKSPKSMLVHVCILEGAV